jgi:hypothetical protein
MFASFKRLMIRELHRRGYCVTYGEPATFPWDFGSFGGRTEGFCFIQVGAYDGRESDTICEYIRRYRWRGLLAEPRPDIIERLKLNYAGLPGLTFECATIIGQVPSLTAD